MQFLTCLRVGLNPHTRRCSRPLCLSAGPSVPGSTGRRKHTIYDWRHAGVRRGGLHPRHRRSSRHSSSYGGPRVDARRRWPVLVKIREPFALALERPFSSSSSSSFGLSFALLSFHMLASALGSAVLAHVPTSAAHVALRTSLGFTRARW